MFKFLQQIFDSQKKNCDFHTPGFHTSASRGGGARCSGRLSSKSSWFKAAPWIPAGKMDRGAFRQFVNIREKLPQIFFYIEWVLFQIYETFVVICCLSCFGNIFFVQRKILSCSGHFLGEDHDRKPFKTFFGLVGGRPTAKGPPKTDGFGTLQLKVPGRLVACVVFQMDGAVFFVIPCMTYDRFSMMETAWKMTEMKVTSKLRRR